MKHLLFKLLIVMNCLIISNFSAISAPPNFISAQIIDQGNNLYQFELKFQRSGGTPTSAFLIYIINADNSTPNDNLFGLDATVPNPNDTVNQVITYYHDVVGDGDFSIYIRALENGVPSAPSTVKKILGWVRPSDAIVTFTSNPGTTGYVSQQYTYQATATVTPSGSVTYSKLSGPASLTVSTSGLVKWINPSPKGIYHISIKATLTTNSQIFAIQNWNLTIEQCQNYGSIGGVVNDESGNPVNSGYVDIYAEVTDSNTTHWVMIGTTPIGSDGTYSYNCDGGNYQLYVHGDSFDPEWYENQTSQSNATTVNVTCANVSTADFVVHVLPPHFTLSGKVYESNGTTPIHRAVVKCYGMLPGEVIPSITEKTTTTSNGDYSFSLSNEFEYVVMAEGPSPDSMSTLVDYISEFWNSSGNTTNPNGGERIILTANKTGVDFNLDQVLNYQNKIYGQVNGLSNGNHIPSWVIIFYVQGDDVPSLLYSLRSCDATGTNGKFEFKGIACNNAYYVLQSIPSDLTNYSAGYFLNGGTDIVTDWNNATQIPILTNTSSFDATIIHQQNTNPSPGVGIFDGTIVGLIPKINKEEDNSNKIQATEPCPGAVVYVMTKDKNKIVKCAAADNKGNFEVTGLPLVDYNIIVDKVGFEKTITTIKLDKENTKASKSIELQPMPNDVDDEQNYTLPYLAVYPNPSTDMVNLDYYTKDNSVNICIANTLGEIVYSSVIGTIPGSNKIGINIKDINSGLYLIKISGKHNNQSIPMIISR
jgi:hypothetical protein